MVLFNKEEDVLTDTLFFERETVPIVIGRTRDPQLGIRHRRTTTELLFERETGIEPATLSLGS